MSFGLPEHASPSGRSVRPCSMEVVYEQGVVLGLMVSRKSGEMDLLFRHDKLELRAKKFRLLTSRSRDPFSAAQGEGYGASPLGEQSQYKRQKVVRNIELYRL
jgi:hypothetical protein